ncbi:MAG: DoxX family protein [Leptospira sp.]|nr:DoxX family protein [Leptospira sp.]
MEIIVLLARILFGAIFIIAGPGHFTTERISHAAQLGVPLASVIVPLSGIIALLGGLSIVLGFKAVWGGWLTVIFLIPVTVMMHQFWNAGDPVTLHVQQAMFIKNISMLGAALLITHFGSGPYSLKH